LSRLLTCLACGHEGWDVETSLVRYDDPIEVEVALAVSTDGHGRVLGNEIRRVPGIYGAEWRCLDRDACAARVAALPPPPAKVDAFFEGASDG
jgi:hypothetical protein